MRRRTFLGSVAAAGLAGCTRARAQVPSAASSPLPAIALGDSVLFREFASDLTYASLGIITNQTGVDELGRSIVDRARERFHVRALFSPEHGLRGDRPAGAFVESYVDERSGLPVYSLYGPDRHPSKKMLDGIDVLLFDIQDVGARTYTFVSTMAYAMQSAAANGIEFWVLDRPNPIGGSIVEGPVLEPAYESFIGLYPIPMRHGMTVGELARLFNEHFSIGVKLRVVPMDGWRRAMIWPQTGLQWIRTSPNIPTWQTTFVYPCTGLIDSTGLNNGVGTPAPFFYAGAPHADAVRFTAALAALHPPGVAFEAATWTPLSGANAGLTFSGVRLDLSDPATFLPVHLSVAILATARDLYPSALNLAKTRIVDINWGTDAVRSGLAAGKSAAEITNAWTDGVTAFMALRERFLLYP